ncbi:MAG: spore germination protein [Clostridia bacterium]|nr:spore germination protein [Clostridia bacterium]
MISKLLTLALTFLLTAASLTGCWDRREINELAFQSCIAFDLEGGQRVLTSELVQPAAASREKGGGGTTLPQRQVIIASARSATLLGAGRETAPGLPRRAYLAHTTAVLVGEEMARHGLEEVLEFVDRHPELRRTTLVLLTRGPAREILIKAQGALETNLGKEIAGLHRWAPVSGFSFIPNLNDVFFDLSNGAAATVLPVVELSPEPFPPILGAGTTAGGGASPGTAATGQRTAQPETINTLYLRGAGLFYHTKLVGWLDERQTRGLAWARNKARGGILELPCAGADTRVAVDVTEARGQVKIDTKGGKLQGKINVQVEGELLEEQCQVDFTKEEALKSLQDQMAALVTAEISSALEQTKGAGADVFGFGGALYRRQPKLWRQLHQRWQEEFKKMPITIEVQAKVRRTGTTRRPWQPRVH